MTSKNVKMRPKCVDLMKMTSKNVKMRPKCDDLVKMTSKNAKMRPKCDDLMKMTSKIVKMSKFVKILIDALVVTFGIYGVDFPPSGFPKRSWPRLH